MFVYKVSGCGFESCGSPNNMQDLKSLVHVFIVHDMYTYHTFEGHKYGAQNIHSVTKTSGNLILNLIYILIILDYMSLKVNKFVCFKNNEGSYEVHNIVYNSWKKSYKEHIFLWCSYAP